MSNASLIHDRIFLGIARPKSWFGADFNHIIMSFMITACFFLVAKNPFFLIIFFPLHIAGIFLFKLDPYFYTTLRTLADTKITPFLQTSKSWNGSISFSPIVTRWNKVEHGNKN